VQSTIDDNEAGRVEAFGNYKRLLFDNGAALQKLTSDNRSLAVLHLAEIDQSKNLQKLLEESREAYDYVVKRSKLNLQDAANELSSVFGA
jgi:hypothetical protein